MCTYDLWDALTERFTKLMISDKYGVSIHIREEGGYIEVVLAIPAALPGAVRAELEQISTQRIYFSRHDLKRVGRKAQSDSAFMQSISRAVDLARETVIEATFAHANAAEWTRFDLE